MGAFLSALSGVGQGAGQYGEQVRGLLEQRRGDFANLIAKAAEQESDPQTRAAMLQHSADLLSGKPIGNIAQKFSQTLDKRHADNQALIQTIGQPPQAPQPQPGTAPGVTPGNAVPPDSGMYVGGIQNGKAPTPAPAAQPASNPVQPGAQAIPPVGAPSPVAIASAAPPMTESLGMPAGMQIPGLPTPQDPREIVRRAMENPLWQAPANRPILLQGAQQELSHQEALRQALETKQATIAYAQNAIQHMKADGSWDKLPDFYRAELQMAASGVNAPSFPAGMVLPHLISAGTMGSQAPPGTKIFGTEDLVKPNERYRVMNIPAYGNIWQPEQAQTTITTTENGRQQISNRQTGDAMAPVQGAVNPAFVPSTSVQSAPGEASVTTVRRKGGGAPGAASAPPAIPPVGAGGAGGGGGTPRTPSGDPLVRKEYEDWAAGGPAPTGRKLSAVQGYAAANNLPTPIALSASGTKDLRDVEDVLRQISELKKGLEDRKLQNDHSRSYYPEYFKYAHLGDESDPSTGFWTGLSFEAIRSAATALKGTNSRALPIINRALEHTPNPTADAEHLRLPDTPAQMYNKLSEMQKILTMGREDILADERKTGVVATIKPVGGGTVKMKAPNGTVQPVPADQVEHYKRLGAQVVQ